MLQLILNAVFVTFIIYSMVENYKKQQKTGQGQVQFKVWVDPNEQEYTRESILTHQKLATEEPDKDKDSSEYIETVELSPVQKLVRRNIKDTAGEETQPTKIQPSEDPIIDQLNNEFRNPDPRSEEETQEFVPIIEDLDQFDTSNLRPIGTLDQISYQETLDSARWPPLLKPPP